MTTTTQTQPAGYLTGDSPAEARIPVYRTPKGKLTLDPPKVEDYARGGYTSPNFKVGDKVRRTKPFLGFQPQHTVTPGEVYTVAGHTASGGLKLVGKAPEFGYLASSFELVIEPEPSTEETEAAARILFRQYSGWNLIWDHATDATRERFLRVAKKALLAAQAVAK